MTIETTLLVNLEHLYSNMYRDIFLEKKVGTTPQLITKIFA
jgi:hypothetical protein